MRATRTGLLVLFAFGLISAAVSAWSVSVQGVVGGVFDPTAAPFVWRATVIRIGPNGGPAASAGLRNGDLVDVRGLSSGDRFDLAFTRERGHEFVLSTIGSGPPRTIKLVAQPYSLDWWGVAFFAAMLWLLLFGGLILWRGPRNAPAYLLCGFLLLFPLATYWFPPNMWLPWPWPGLRLASALVMAPTAASFALLAAYVSLFGRPLSPIRRILTWLAYACAAAGVSAEAARYVAAWTGVPLPLAAWIQPAGVVFMLAIPPLLCALAAVAAARGEERARVLWGVLGLAPVFAGELTIPTITIVAPALLTTLLPYELQNSLLFLAPLGMTYALFSRRLLDIAFVLNRAAIFAGVSVVIVGTFVLVEWGLSDWMQRASHSTNILVSGAVALVLGLSIRSVHARVEHAVDRVIFRKRRAAEEAIRTTAVEASYITDRDTLLERTEYTLLQHADASSVDVLLDDEAGNYGGVGENDPAVVRLRVTHEVLDLHDSETALNGDLAFPMVARGRLVGIIVLGPRPSGEAYAPDESAAIAQLARSVGSALDLLSARGLDSAQSTAAAIAEAVRPLGEKIDALARKMDGVSTISTV